MESDSTTQNSIVKAVRYLQGRNGAATEDILLRCPNQLDSETATTYLDNAADRGILNRLSNGRYAVNKRGGRQKSKSSSKKKPSGTRRPRSKTRKGSGGRRSSSKTKKRSSSKRQKGRKSPTPVNKRARRQKSTSNSRKKASGSGGRRSSSKTKKRSSAKSKSPAGKKTESKRNSRRRSTSVETQTPEFVEVQRHVVECLVCGDVHVCHKQSEGSSDQKQKKKKVFNNYA